MARGGAAGGAVSGGCGLAGWGTHGWHVEAQLPVLYLVGVGWRRCGLAAWHLAAQLACCTWWVWVSGGVG